MVAYNVTGVRLLKTLVDTTGCAAAMLDTLSTPWVHDPSAVSKMLLRSPAADSACTVASSSVYACHPRDKVAVAVAVAHRIHDSYMLMVLCGGSFISKMVSAAA